MPFTSEKQRRLMHAKHPLIANRWEKKYGSKIVKKGSNVANAIKERSK